MPFDCVIKDGCSLLKVCMSSLSCDFLFDCSSSSSSITTPEESILFEGESTVLFLGV